MGKPLKELAEAMKVLTPERVKLIRRIMVDGLDILTTYDPRHVRDYTPRVNADVRNSHIVAEGRRQTEGRTDIRVTVKRGRVLFIIEERLCLSFKKLDRRLRSRNIPTWQARRFERQMPLGIDLPPELTNVVAGYTLDQVGTPTEMFVTCPDEKENHWVLPLGAVAGVAEPLELPTTPVAPAPRPRIIPKPGQMPRRESDGSAE